MTLAFAPGAILTLGAGATLDIQGPIDIGSSGRFSLVGGRVILSGSLDAIHASWWVDESSGGAPLVHALAALWERYERSLDPAPILVTGPYLLEETVHIVPSESLSRSYTTPFDVVIRGRCRGSTAPLTFRASDSKAVGAMDALVAVDGKVSLVMENVGFDLRRSAGLASVRTALLLAGDHDRTSLEGCSFRLAGSTGVHITALWDGWREAIGEALTSTAGVAGPFAPLGAAFASLVLGAAMMASVTRRPDRVSIARCDFEGGEPSSVGVRVDPVAPTLLDVADCQFRGAYDCGIRFVGSDLMVTNCGFDNMAMLITSKSMLAADILLGSLEALPAEISRLAGVNAQLTATHCVSTSPNFLIARRGFTSGDSGGAVLTNVFHRPRTTAPTESCTSVRWIGPLDRRSLVLQGCEFDAPVRLEGTPPPGVVVNLGVRFAEALGTGFLGGTPDSVVTLYSP